jgi:hypothetical protein
MGGDGGVIAVKRKFIRIGNEDSCSAAPDENESKYSRMDRSRQCYESGGPLQLPIVCCRRGHLYNKDVLINFLLEEKSQRKKKKHLKHIKKLSDMKELKLTKASSSNSSDKAAPGDAEGVSMTTADYICPVTGLEFNGLNVFVVFWESGDVISEKAMTILGSEALKEEYGDFKEEDLVKLFQEPTTTTTETDVAKDKEKEKGEESLKEDVK